MALEKAKGRAHGAVMEMRRMKVNKAKGRKMVQNISSDVITPASKILAN